MRIDANILLNILVRENLAPVAVSEFNDNYYKLEEVRELEDLCNTIKSVEIFEVTPELFTGDTGDTWMEERMAMEHPEQSPEDRFAWLDAGAKKLSGFYWWTCPPGGTPKEDRPYGPFSGFDAAVDHILSTHQD